MNELRIACYAFGLLKMGTQQSEEGSIRGSNREAEEIIQSHVFLD